MKSLKAIFKMKILRTYFIFAVISIALATSVPLQETKIIGGEPAAPGEFPYAVVLQTYIPPPFNTNLTFCGGALVEENGKQFILTAAQCAAEPEEYEIQVIAGELDKWTESGKEQIRVVNQVVKHPWYNSQRFTDDIAILGINVPFNLTEDVQPIRLPAHGQNTKGSVIVTGFGGDERTERGEIDLGLLEKLQVDVISHKACESAYESSTQFAPDANKHLCAYSRSGTNAHCFGDRGSPAEAVDGGYLAGLVTYPQLCRDAEEGAPDVFTNVANYVDWVREASRQLQN